MSGCSLHEAFPDTATRSGQKARRDERARAKKCQSPALAFLKATGDVDLDPDRQALVPLTPAEKLTRADEFAKQKLIQGFSSGTSVEPQYVGANESYAGQIMGGDPAAVMGKKVNDVIGSGSGSGSASGREPAAATSASQLPDITRSQDGTPVPSYFGKSENQGFADFSKSLTDNTGYQIPGADFLGSFRQSGLDKPSGEQNLPIPNINSVWKPITPSGTNTSFFDSSGQRDDSIFSKDEKESLLSKLDTLFARLEDLESKKNEYSHVEVSIFILSGLFLLFGLETVRKIR
jgi:hypothetical protein